ncbi:peptide-methionine (R)-S-oxide reductase [Botryobacter ruber]|uniref:peptide-methionine (R)-S-oxide reductase n=1 Tax=Botryobacter ruber TaxID=2171629 RepID=UPI000E0BE3DF|nr:peptide-methionine (R)-S-oxide reductase [Botryobacter ruber]
MLRNQKINPAAREQERGTYTCARCGTALFEASKKFEVGSGFPSFWAHIANNVDQKPLDTYGRNRIQLLCHTCGLHLGHLFDDARTPTHVRYCINADSINLTESTK